LAKPDEELDANESRFVEVDPKAFKVDLDDEDELDSDLEGSDTDSDLE